MPDSHDEFFTSENEEVDAWFDEVAHMRWDDDGAPSGIPEPELIDPKPEFSS